MNRAPPKRLRELEEGKNGKQEDRADDRPCGETSPERRTTLPVRDGGERASDHCAEPAGRSSLRGESSSGRRVANPAHQL